MGMFGRRHVNSVYLFADFIKHHPVVLPELYVVQAFMVLDVLFVPCLVNVAQCNDIVAPREITSPLPSNSA